MTASVENLIMRKVPPQWNAFQTSPVQSVSSWLIDFEVKGHKWISIALTKSVIFFSAQCTGHDRLLVTPWGSCGTPDVHYGTVDSTLNANTCSPHPPGQAQQEEE